MRADALIGLPPLRGIAGLIREYRDTLHVLGEAVTQSSSQVRASGRIGDLLRVLCQVPQGHKRVGLAAAERRLKAENAVAGVGFAAER